MEEDSQLDKVAKGLRILSKNIPRSVETRIASSLSHFEKSQVLLDVDLEMASFRAICGEEEAASAVISALHHRQYADAKLLNIRSHRHKWAIIGCVMALSASLKPILSKFQLQIDFANGRIDLKIPLSNFGVAGGDAVALQPVEPLDILHSKTGLDGDYTFEAELDALADGLEFDNIRDLVKAMANSRNRLLYASDTKMPKSETTPQQLEVRRSRAVALLTIAVMILQSKKKLATVRQALPAILKVIGRLPSTNGP